jgi:hypothetical protein
VILAPRHVERGPAIVELAKARGLTATLRSQSGDVANILVADTLGEMGLWFRLAGTSLIAGSLVEDIGGHNPLEAARLDCPAISGPFVENWTSAFAGLEAAGGVVMTTPDKLRDAIATDFADPAAAKARAARARASSTPATPRPAPGCPASSSWSHETRHASLVVREDRRPRPADPRPADPTVVDLVRRHPPPHRPHHIRHRRRAGDLRRQRHHGRRGQDPDRPRAAADPDQRGVAAHGLSRGYGGKLKGPVQVDTAATPPPTSATSR